MATPYVGHYIDRAAVERRVSVAVVRRIYDDNNDGSADVDPLNQLIQDAEAMFEGYCRGTYVLTSLRTARPSEAIRLVLDCVEFLMAKRFPRALARDWTVLESSVRDELKELRRGNTRFDVEGTPEPGANQGGQVYVGDTAVTTTDEPAFFAIGGTGLF